MSLRGEWFGFNSFKAGQRSDLPPHVIGDDALLEATNVVTDKVGRIAKRGPISNYLFGSKSDAVLQRLSVPSINLNGALPPFGFGVSNANWYTFDLPNPSTIDRSGSLSSAQAFSGPVGFSLAQPQWGPSFNSYGLSMFPLRNSNNTVKPIVAFAGSRTNALSASYSALTVTVTANRQDITITGGPSFSDSYVGSFIYLRRGVSPVETNEYVGVITSVNSATSINVFPTPSASFTSAAGAGSGIISPFFGMGGVIYETGGSRNIPASSKFGCVHQNRIVSVVNATTTFSGSLYTDAAPTMNNVISWSALTGESTSAVNTGCDGFLGLLVGGWPYSQRLTLDTAGITGIVSLDANNLLVLCVDKTLLISGKLGTILPSVNANDSSFNIRTVSPNIGCISEDSIQRTPVGVMFAGRDGVYVTDGAKFANVMEGKIQQKWKIYNTNKDAYPKGNRVTGSAVLDDTHYVVFAEKGPSFICDIYNDFSWTLMEFVEDSAPLANYIESLAFAPAVTPFGYPPSTFLPPNEHTVGVNADASILFSTVRDSTTGLNFAMGWKNTGTRTSPNYETLIEAATSPSWAGTTFVSVDINHAGDRAVVLWQRTLAPQRYYARWYKKVTISGTEYWDFLKDEWIGSPPNHVGATVAMGKSGVSGGARTFVGEPATNTVYWYEQNATPTEFSFNGTFLASGTNSGRAVDVCDTATSNVLIFSYTDTSARGAVRAVKPLSPATFFTITSPNFYANDEFGYAISGATGSSMTSNDGYIVVGAPKAGIVYVYRADGTLFQTIQGPLNRRFGHDVSIARGASIPTQLAICEQVSGKIHRYELRQGVFEYVNTVTQNPNTGFGSFVTLAADTLSMHVPAPRYNY